MNNNRTKILSILPLLGHPRDSKRIAMLREVGFDVEAAAFLRDYHSGRMPDCEVVSLGRVAHGRYCQRFFKIIRALPAMRRAIKRNQAIYASGADMAFMALLAGIGLEKPLVVEIGDIREIQVAPGIMGHIARFIDKQLVKTWDFLVATTPSFINVYYREWLKSTVPAMVIENKVEKEFADRVARQLSRSRAKGEPLLERPLRLGYFGGLRCEWSCRVLEAYAKASPNDVEIILAGYVMVSRDLIEQLAKCPNIKYLGEYKSPEDLPSLYEEVDLIWGCYQPIGPDDWNLRWARPNRFYESCLFRTPIVSREGSCDALDVKRFEIGFIIEDVDIQKTADRLCSITSENLRVWKKNMADLPQELYSYTTEAELLGESIKTLLQKTLRLR